MRKNTFRDYLMYCDFGKVLEALEKKHRHLHDDLPFPAGEKIKMKNAYMEVVSKLLAFPQPSAHEHPIYITYVPPDGRIGMDEDFVDVCLLNQHYEAPPPDLKPWGGDGDDDIPPEGCFNCNADKHNEFFAFGYSPWSKVVDAPVMVNDSPGLKKLAPTDEDVLAEILWELTFYGFSEEDMNQVKADLEKAAKEFKDGKSGEPIDIDDFFKELE